MQDIPPILTPVENSLVPGVLTSNIKSVKIGWVSWLRKGSAWPGGRGRRFHFSYHLTMWEGYSEAAKRYPKLSLAQERLMIAAAQAGRNIARDELVLRHISFLMWRLRTKVFRQHLERHGDDLLSAAILTLYQKIRTYDLNYRDRGGVLKPVRFASYVWKRIDGLAIDYLKRESRSGVPFDETRHLPARLNLPAKIRQKTLLTRPT